MKKFLLLLLVLALGACGDISRIVTEEFSTPPPDAASPSGAYAAAVRSWVGAPIEEVIASGWGIPSGITQVDNLRMEYYIYKTDLRDNPHAVCERKDIGWPFGRTRVCDEPPEYIYDCGTVMVVQNGKVLSVREGSWMCDEMEIPPSRPKSKQP
jgi:hypothetical protein